MTQDDCYYVTVNASHETEKALLDATCTSCQPETQAEDALEAGFRSFALASRPQHLLVFAFARKIRLPVLSSIKLHLLLNPFAT